MRTLFEGLGGGCVAVAMSDDAKYVVALSVGSQQVSHVILYYLNHALVYIQIQRSMSA